MIRNIWAVGRNYSEHAKELGNPVPREPLFFLKAGSCITRAQTIKLPAWTKEVHHEIELAFQFGPNLKLSKIGLALDLTERQTQSRLKEKQAPWTLAKSFIDSCPLSELVTIPENFDLNTIAFQLSINHQTRQKGNSQQMIFPIAHLVDFAIHHFPVCENDILLTGTPPGVGPLSPGDQLHASIDGLIEWSLEVTA